jgi:hypothetical protein
MFSFLRNLFKKSPKKFFVSKIEVEKVCQGFIIKTHTKNNADAVNRYLEIEGFKKEVNNNHE